MTPAAFIAKSAAADTAHAYFVKEPPALYDEAPRDAIARLLALNHARTTAE